MHPLITALLMALGDQALLCAVWGINEGAVSHSPPSFLEINVYWNAALPIRLWIVSGCFLMTVAALGGGDRNHVTHEPKILTIQPFTKEKKEVGPTRG